MKPRHLLGLLAVVALIVVDLALRFRDPGKYAAQERLEEGAISDEALDIAINAFPGEGVTNTFDVWEWRLFYPWAPEDDIHHGHELLEEIVEQVTRIATRIGYREKDVQVSRRNPESRTDVYIDIGEEDIGMKYRGRQAREIETKGVFLELKVSHYQSTRDMCVCVYISRVYYHYVSLPSACPQLRKRIRYQKGFFSGRNYSMEAWDKLVSTSIDVDAGSKAIVDVLQQAVDEFDRFKVGNKAEQFRYNPVKDKLLRQAIAAAEAPGAVRKVSFPVDGGLASNP